MLDKAYKRLAKRLDALPNGFPPTTDSSELRLLAKLFTPEEAKLAAGLRLTPETPEEIAARLGGDADKMRDMLKDMARRGLIAARRTDDGLGFGLLPFVVGIYEMQVGRMDAELAELFEEYYLAAFGRTLAVQPSVHRVIPVGESIRMDMEVAPHESAVEITMGAAAWGVQECICRKQKALLGDPCGHPLEVCLVLHRREGAFEGHPTIRPLSLDEALGTLRKAAQAGLVHSVSNVREEVGYICNCCTCSCGILRGVAELGVANAVVRSAFVNQVDEELCYGCELCLEHCQFEALAVEDGMAAVNALRCVGCGVCVPSCPDGALQLVRRPEEEVLPIPAGEAEWRAERSAARGLDLGAVL